VGNVTQNRSEEEETVRCFFKIKNIIIHNIVSVERQLPFTLDDIYNLDLCAGSGGDIAKTLGSIGSSASLSGVLLDS
jgi:hypothetical protein